MAPAPRTAAAARESPSLLHTGRETHTATHSNQIGHSLGQNFPAASLLSFLGHPSPLLLQDLPHVPNKSLQVLATEEPRTAQEIEQPLSWGCVSRGVQRSAKRPSYCYGLTMVLESAVSLLLLWPYYGYNSTVCMHAAWHVYMPIPPVVRAPVHSLARPPARPFACPQYAQKALATRLSLYSSTIIGSIMPSSQVSHICTLGQQHSTARARSSGSQSE